MADTGICPRGTTPLGGGEDALACPRCGGVFVRKPGIEALVEAPRTGREVTFFSSPYRSAPPPTSQSAGDAEAVVKYLVCPVSVMIPNILPQNDPRIPQAAA